MTEHVFPFFDVENRWYNHTSWYFYQTVCLTLLLYCHKCYIEWIWCTDCDHFSNVKHVFCLVAAVTRNVRQWLCLWILFVCNKCLYVCLCVVALFIWKYTSRWSYVIMLIIVGFVVIRILGCNYTVIITDCRISMVGNAITSSHPSVHLLPLYLQNWLTVNLELLHVSRSWPLLAGDWRSRSRSWVRLPLIEGSFF